MACAGPRPLRSSCRASAAFLHPLGAFPVSVLHRVLAQQGRGAHPSLTQRDGSTALSTAVVLTVQPALRADVQLVLSLVTDLGADTGFGDEVQALAVTAVITPCGRKYPSLSKIVQITTAYLGGPSPEPLHTHTPSAPLQCP